MKASRSTGNRFALVGLLAALPLSALVIGCAADAAPTSGEGTTASAESELRPRLSTYGEACGGIAGFRCNPRFTCVDDPRDTCDPTQHGSDCIGVCVLPRQSDDVGTACGGLRAPVCPSDLSCFEDPTDDCDPANGGADCIGVCAPERPIAPKP